MSDRLPYEERLSEQLNDLPLPDENLAWGDMRRRLDKDDDDRGFFLFRLPGCVLWGLMLLLVIAVGWWVIRPEKWFTGKTADEKITSVPAQKEPGDTRNNPVLLADTSQRSKGKSENEKKEEVVTDKQPLVSGSGNKKVPDQKSKDKSQNEKMEAVVTGTEPSAFRTSNKKTAGQRSKVKSQKEKIDVAVTGAELSIRKTNNKKAAGVKSKNEKSQKEKTGIVVRDQGPPVLKTTNDTTGVVRKKDITIVPASDTVAKPSIDSTTKPVTPASADNKSTETVKANQPKKDSAKKENISFSIGMAMQQQLPVNGQKMVPYNSLGRKGTLRDYIPSVYFRIHRDDKWFLQSEFRYGVPQYTKEFLYKQKITVDTPGPPVTTTTSARLKKTFYHQLPLTFNYFVLPDWSVGTGIVWNKFVSAISEQEIRRRLPGTTLDSVISNGIIKTPGADSNFAKSYFQAVLETQYRWKRFSIGARYAFGLQPYIKFTLPGGTQQEEKNSSLQLFLRFELWKSKEKN